MNLLLFLDISGGEFLIILLGAFFLFGPKKLPEIARKLGRTMNEIKNISGDLTREFRNETSNITNELKSARELARTQTNDIKNVIETDPFSVRKSETVNPHGSETTNESHPKQSYNEEKPISNQTVTNPTNNNEPFINVIRENKQTEN